MRSICQDCPVIKECARYGLNGEVSGGFYAGVWLPWQSSSESPDIKAIRRFNRDELKILLGDKPMPKSRRR